MKSKVYTIPELINCSVCFLISSLWMGGKRYCLVNIGCLAIVIILCVKTLVPTNLSPGK